MRTILACMMVVLGVAVVTAQKIQHPSSPSMDSFYVMIEGEKIELGDPFEKILTLYGETEFTIRKYSNRSLRQYDYDGIAIFLFDGDDGEKIEEEIILGFEITSDQYPIIGGLTVGARLGEVTAILGEPWYIFENSYYYYNDEYDTLVITFKFDGAGKVAEIRLSLGT